MLVTAILAFLHVLTAIAWLGGGMLFGFVIGPRISRMSPATSREFIVSVFPSITRFFQAIAGSTILFGLLLLLNMTGGNLREVSTSTAWGVSVSLGMLTAIVAFVVTEAGAAPAMSRMVALQRAAPETPTGPPEGLPQAAKRAATFSMITAVFLFLTLAFMVGAGFY